MRPMRVVAWGTHDLGKPRNRILLRGLRENGVEVVSCHSDVWGGMEDKSQVRGTARLKRVLRWLLAYPALLIRYLRLSGHDAVLVGYLGQLDVLLLWPLARARGVPVVWDVFLSLHDTVVGDRRLVSPGHPLARLLFAWEWLACRAADRVLMDTRAHAAFLSQTYGLDPARVAAVPVGVEPEAFPPAPRSCRDEDPVRVLFYGQLIPLHGVETLLRAARLTRGEPFEWTLIGDGQEAGEVERLLAEEPLEHLRWVRWVPYGELASWLHEADLCLGIFGTSGKAARVIPNKVYQILAAGKPLITRDGPAVRDLVSDGPGVYLVPPGDPDALAAALRRFREDRPRLAGPPLHGELRRRIDPVAVGARLVEILHEVTGYTPGS